MSDLTAEEKTLCEKYGHYCPNCDNSFPDVERLRAENMELQRDKERLDWLQRNDFLAQKIFWDIHTHRVRIWDVRQAIDAAMSEKGKA